MIPTLAAATTFTDGSRVVVTRRRADASRGAAPVSTPEGVR